MHYSMVFARTGPVSHSSLNSSLNSSQTLDTPANTKQTHVIIMDFSKAFDEVPHNWLVLKFNFSGNEKQYLRLD